LYYPIFVVRAMHRRTVMVRFYLRMVTNLIDIFTSSFLLRNWPIDGIFWVVQFFERLWGGKVKRGRVFVLVVDRNNIYFIHTGILSKNTVEVRTTLDRKRSNIA
jgi:hypothetical protein